MIPFKINGQTYRFPTCWPDVTYAQYVALIHTVTLADQISVFTGIPRETLERAEIKNLEKISIALSFLSISPKFDRTAMVGPYYVPSDVTIESLAQFESLRSLLIKMPKEMKTVEAMEEIADLYLHACAVYCQKVRDKEYDFGRATIMKEQMKKYSCAEVIGTGAFFLFKPLNTSKTITTRYRNLLLHLKRLIQGLPGYRRTLDLLQRFTGLPAR